MLEVNLSVPYKSQWDPDATLTANDCGPTSIAMVLNFLGQNLTTDQVYKLTGAGQGLISFSQMATAIAKLGFSSQFVQNQTPVQLKAYLDQGIPVIALVHYGSMGETRQDKKFTGGHFFVVVGYRDDGYFVNDPNFRDKFRPDGDHHFYSKADFEKAWQESSLDKNPVCSLIVIAKQSQLPAIIELHRNVVILPDEGANVRNQPQASGKNITNVLRKGTKIAVDGFVRGEVVDGNPYWWKVKGYNEYVWSGVTDVIPTEKMAQTSPPPPVPDSGKSIEQLSADLETQKTITKQVIAESAEKDRKIIGLEKERDEWMRKYNEVDDIAGEIKGYKHTNEELIKQNKEQEIAYQQKIGELKQQLTKAKVTAFEGWDLVEIPAGGGALSAVPSLALKLTALIGDIMKNGYVFGWKRGGRLVRVDPEAPMGANAAPRQPVSKLIQ